MSGLGLRLDSGPRQKGSVNEVSSIVTVSSKRSSIFGHKNGTSMPARKIGGSFSFHYDCSFDFLRSLCPASTSQNVTERRCTNLWKAEVLSYKYYIGMQSCVCVFIITRTFFPIFTWNRSETDSSDPPDLITV